MAKISINPELYTGSRYSTVIGIAKRAREISEDCMENKIIIDTKPVRIAMQELVDGKYRIVSAEEAKKLRENKGGLTQF